jgi:hypothetical protein
MAEADDIVARRRARFASAGELIADLEKTGRK